MKKRIMSVLTVALLLVLSTSAQAEPNNQALYESYCEEIGEEYGICAELLEAICFKESTWRPTVKSSDGRCIGLMQINPAVHKDRMEKLGVTDLTDAYSNILVGADYLLELFEEYGDVYEVLMIFNMGNRGRELYEQGIYSHYAESICEMSMELEREHGK